MSYLEMKVADLLENLEETGYNFEEVAKRMAMSLSEVKEFIKEFSDNIVEDENAID